MKLTDRPAPYHYRAVQNLQIRLYGMGKGQSATDQQLQVSEKRQGCSFAAPPHGSSSSPRRISRGQPSDSGSPREPRSHSAPAPRRRTASWAPHRTLQLPKPKRGALLSAGIWVVVKRLHCLVHELQCRLCSFHGGGGPGGGYDSDSSPEALGAPPSRFLTVSATAAP